MMTSQLVITPQQLEHIAWAWVDGWSVWGDFLVSGGGKERKHALFRKPTMNHALEGESLFLSFLPLSRFSGETIRKRGQK